MAAYLAADLAGRTRRMMPCRISHHSSARNLDHARVAQELGQVAAQRRRRGRVGRAQVDQQHAVAGRAAVLVGGSPRKLIGAAASAHRPRARRACLSAAQGQRRSRGAGCGVDRLGPVAGEAGVGRAPGAHVGAVVGRAQVGRHLGQRRHARAGRAAARSRRCRAGAGRCTSSCRRIARAPAPAPRRRWRPCDTRTPGSAAQASSNSITLMRSSST